MVSVKSQLCKSVPLCQTKQQHLNYLIVFRRKEPLGRWHSTLDQMSIQAMHNRHKQYLPEGHLQNVGLHIDGLLRHWKEIDGLHPFQRMKFDETWTKKHELLSSVR